MYMCDKWVVKVMIDTSDNKGYQRDYHILPVYLQCMHTITNKCYWDTSICSTITLVPLWLTQDKRHAGIEVGPLFLDIVCLCWLISYMQWRNRIIWLHCLYWYVGTACWHHLRYANTMHHTLTPRTIHWHHPPYTDTTDTTHHTLTPLTIHWHHPLSEIRVEQPVNHPSWSGVHVPVSCCIVKGNPSLHTLGLLPIHYHSHPIFILMPSYTTSRWDNVLNKYMYCYKYTN